MTEFFTYFTFPRVFPPAHNYPQDASEVEWWLAHQHVAIAAPEGVVQAFVLVHGKVSNILISAPQCLSI
jgi:hypothetical protein